MRKGDLNRDQYLILARPAVQNWTEFKTNFDLNGDGATRITADPSSKSTLNSDQVWTSLVQRDLSSWTCGWCWRRYSMASISNAVHNGTHI